MKWDAFGQTDFEQLAGVFAAMGWNWANNRPPTADEIRARCTGMAKSLEGAGFGASCITGRLRVRKFKPLTGHHVQAFSVELQESIRFEAFSNKEGATGAALAGLRAKQRAEDRIRRAKRA